MIKSYFSCRFFD